MKITFVMDGIFRKPTGGPKIIYQYANHFASRGHQVTIVYGISEPAGRYRSFVPYEMRRAAVQTAVMRGPKWFQLNKGIRRIYADAICEDTVPDGDAVFATAIGTARPVAVLSERKGKKYYLIQDFENWNCTDAEVNETYRLGMTNITISKWLDEIVYKNSGRKTICIPNAIDGEVFREYVPNRERNPHSISMIYQTGEHKGFRYGLEVILQLKDRYPDLKCHIFGTPKREQEWPNWIQYTRNASEKKLVKIYNESAVFLSSSVVEGFGLCGAESMACGCAFVTTGYSGVYTYAQDGFNALVSPVMDVKGLYSDVCRLFDDKGLREIISENGMETIKELSWENSFAQMDSLLE